VSAYGYTGPVVAMADVAGLPAALDDLQEQIDEIDGGGGGGGGSPVAVVVGHVSTGNVVPQNTGGAVQVLTGGPTFAIAAEVGDRVRCDVTYLTERNINSFWDLAVIVSGSAVRYATTGTGSAPIEGDPGMYPDQPSYQGRPGPFSFTVEAGDLSGGLVTIGFAVKSTGGGQLFASTAFPLRYTLTNYGEAP
jgi:hypothetical protein